MLLALWKGELAKNKDELCTRWADLYNDEATLNSWQSIRDTAVFLMGPKVKLADMAAHDRAAADAILAMLETYVRR